MLSEPEDSTAIAAGQAGGNAPAAPATQRECALAHARRDIPVFPCHEVLPDGRCSCRKPACDRKGKHPRTENGLNDATKDPRQIEKWWADWPNANIGGRMGAESGLAALDVDPRHGGDASLAKLEAGNGALPETLVAFTGGGGLHYLFKRPAEGFPSGVGNVGP